MLFVILCLSELSGIIMSASENYFNITLKLIFASWTFYILIIFINLVFVVFPAP